MRYTGSTIREVASQLQKSPFQKRTKKAIITGWFCASASPYVSHNIWLALQNLTCGFPIKRFRPYSSWRELFISIFSSDFFSFVVNRFFDRFLLCPSFRQSCWCHGHYCAFAKVHIFYVLKSCVCVCKCYTRRNSRFITMTRNYDSKN